MPLYEYRCTRCGYRFEKIQPFSAEPERECPKCQGELVRPLTAPAFQFKGAGWYVNDYASKSAPASESSATEPKSGADDAKKSGTSDDGKKSAPAAESKPAASSPAPSPAPSSGSAKSDSGS
ncbi:MAG TPA: FmdB family zinc ribbon protein [Terracidiphilus sp.]